MASHVQIEVSSPHYFTASLPPAGVPVFGVIGVLVLAVIAFRLFQTHHRLGGALAVLGAIGMIWLAMPSSVSYRVEGDGNSKTFHLEELKRQEVVEQSVVPLNAIERIDMQSNRGATRIAIIMNNGDQRFPLGEAYMQDDPEQYKALVLMQQMWKNGVVHPAATEALQ